MSMSSSDVVAVPSANPASTANANLSSPTPGSVPDASSSQQTPSSLKQTVVTAKRKEELLLKARSERKRWIRSIPLPYNPETLTNNTDGKIARSQENASDRLWSSHDGLDSFQKSLIFRDRLLPGATTILAELYGITGKDEEDCDGSNGEDSKNLRQDILTSPLSVDNVADRVDKLARPFLTGEVKEGQNSSSSIDEKNSDGLKSKDGETAKDCGENEIRDDRYKDVNTAYEEFTNMMLLPESAVVVQGMKNFVRQFTVTATSGVKEDDDDKLVRNMASAVNSHIRSSYESLVTKNSNNSSTGDAQGQGQPDWDRRSLESFLYGHVKTVVDSTLDRILGNGATPTSPSSPFLMTQTSFDTRLEELQFLQPSHLELKCLNDDRDPISHPKIEAVLEVPIRALQSIESFFSPYEKLCRVLDVYHGVNTILSKASKALPMADDVISAMILVIVKASTSTTSTKNLLRDLHFIENFALQEYKRVGGGEVEYAFTSLYGAVYFLQGVELTEKESGTDQNSSSNRLCISNEELRRGLEKSRALAADSNAKRTTEHGGENNIEGKPEGLISHGVHKLLGEIDSSGIDDERTIVSDFIPTPRQLSVREVRAARLRGETLDLKWALKQHKGQTSLKQTSAHDDTLATSPTKSASKSVFTPQRYTFLGVRPENIKLSDLPRLLDEYRKLVMANEQLLGEHQRANNKIQMERKRLRDEKHRRTLGEQALLL